MSRFKLSSRSLLNMAGVDDRLIRIAVRAIEITVIDFGIPNDGGLRSADRQRELFLEGASKCDGSVKRSKHQSGKALDFYAYESGRATWERLPLALIAAAFLQAAAELGYPITWGGLWLSVDMPHVQLVG